MISVGLAVAAPSVAEPLQFVRIDGLAEQAVGERLLKEVYKRAGMDITVTPMPGKRALAEASSGKKHGETLRIYALGENVPSLIRVPTPLSSLRTAAFGKSGSSVALASAEDLAGFQSVIVAGVLHTEAITDGLPNVTTVRSSDLMFEMVQKERADLALTALLDGQANLKRSGIADVVHVEPVLKTLDLYHYVHESKRDLVPVIDAIISEMTASGELASLRAQFEAEYLASQG